MERFERVLRALIIEEDINIQDIIKAIETVIPKTEQEKILIELCSYLGYDTTVSIVAYLSLTLKSAALNSNPLGAISLFNFINLTPPFQDLFSFPHLRSYLITFLNLS